MKIKMMRLQYNCWTKTREESESVVDQGERYLILQINITSHLFNFMVFLLSRINYIYICY